MNLFSLQWKETFRAPQWEAKLSIKIIIGLFMIYMLGSFVFSASIIYPILYDSYFEKEPLQAFNHVLLYFFFAELIIRFFFQQLPVTNIQTLILLPLSKRRIIFNVMSRSIFSAFNLFPFVIYLPFAISMYRDDYSSSQVFSWWTALLLTTLTLNFINYLINKNKLFFLAVLMALASAVLLQLKLEINLGEQLGYLFDQVVIKPSLLYFFVVLLVLASGALFFYLKRGFYLDGGLSSKKDKVRGGEFKILAYLSNDALFLKNDLKMILRNVRPRQVALMSFLFLFYGVIFYTQEIYREQAFTLVFASLFVTGGFLMTFGNYVPAWDSSYYKLLMTQNISYKKYLLSKWNLMVFAVAISTVLGLPYLYFGWDIYGIIVAGALFNAGLGSWITLFGGLYNKSPMKLNEKAKAFGNTQSFSMSQFFLILPKIVLPVLLYWIPATFFTPLVGIFTLSGSGILGLLYRDKLANLITRYYLKEKHATLAAFNK